MFRNKKQNIVIALLLSATISVSLPVYAVTTQEKLDRANAEKQNTQSKLTSTQDRLAALEEKKGDSESYLAELSKQLDELTAALESLQNQYDSKQAEIEQTQAELDEAKAVEAEQYEAMKLRIQYLYETSASAGLLESLFSTDGFMEFLGRADAYAQITQYDREMLQQYEDTVETVNRKEETLESEQTEIAELQEAKSEQQEQIQSVYEAAYNELRELELSIEDSQSVIAELTSKIETQENEINELLVQKYNEELAAKKAAEEEAARQAAEATAQASSSASSQSSAQTAQTSNQSSSQAASGNTTYLGRFTITGYCGCSKCCGQWASTPVTTASGALAQEGTTVAMGGVAFGTKLLINGHVYTVQDRGTSYGHVDIYCESHSTALAVGLQYADVYMVN